MTLEGHWRAAVTAIIVPMLEGAAVHTAVMAEQLAAGVHGDRLILARLTPRCEASAR